LIDLLALVGVTLLITDSAIFRPIRRIWPALLKCSQCTGMWVGAVAGASGVVAAGHGRALDALIVGASASLSSYVADAVLTRLIGEPIDKKVEGTTNA
jgi:hypothetical protein